MLRNFGGMWYDFRNPSVLPGVKFWEEEGDDQPLVGEELARYRSVAATANFNAQDRPDVKFAVKGLCREMAKPTVASCGR